MISRADLKRREDDNIMPMITSERIEQGVKVVEAAARCAARDSFADLEKREIIHEGNFQRILSQGDKVKAAVTNALTTLLAELAENTVGRLKLISGATKLVLKAADGTKYIGAAKKVFPGWIDGDFKNRKLHVASQPTPETPVQVYELIKDGTFAQVYGGFGENIDRLCLTQHQIIDFVVEYQSWLRTEGYATLFLFKEKTQEADEKEATEKFFVAFVRWSDRELKVLVLRLSRDVVWGAERRHRFVPSAIGGTLSHLKLDSLSL